MPLDLTASSRSGADITAHVHPYEKGAARVRGALSQKSLRSDHFSLLRLVSKESEAT